MDPSATTLVIPAAGIGSRLNTALPKPLVPVNGRPMLAWLIDLFRDHVDRFVVVVHPAHEASVKACGRTLGADIRYDVQPEPTGMLDAILIPHRQVADSLPQHVWITWCDQIAIDRRTVVRLADLCRRNPDAPLILPTARRPAPYIHLARDASGRITRVLHRREGDEMPDDGEGDAGLFSLSREAYLRLLPEYSRDADVGDATGERNFLPFIPWVAARDTVITFDCVDPREAIGVNTPEELAAVGQYLAERQS